MLYQIDYTHSKLQDSAQLGIIAITDLWMQGHQIIYDYNATKNCMGASRMIKTLLQLLKFCGCNESKHGEVYIIMDGSQEALRNACLEKWMYSY